MAFDAVFHMAVGTEAVFEGREVREIQRAAHLAAVVMLHPLVGVELAVGRTTAVTGSAEAVGFAQSLDGDGSVVAHTQVGDQQGATKCSPGYGLKISAAHVEVQGRVSSVEFQTAATQGPFPKVEEVKYLRMPLDVRLDFPEVPVHG